MCPICDKSCTPLKKILCCLNIAFILTGLKKRMLRIWQRLHQNQGFSWKSVQIYMVEWKILGCLNIGFILTFLKKLMLRIWQRLLQNQGFSWKSVQIYMVEWMGWNFDVFLWFPENSLLCVILLYTVYISTRILNFFCENKSVFLTIFFLVVFFPLVSIVALLAATDAIITLSQNAIWALYVGCLLRGATHNRHINSIHQLLEPSCHNRNMFVLFCFVNVYFNIYLTIFLIYISKLQFGRQFSGWKQKLIHTV